MPGSLHAEHEHLRTILQPNTVALESGARAAMVGQQTRAPATAES
jgi:hypothetical protein